MPITPRQLQQRRKYIGSSDTPQLMRDKDGRIFAPWKDAGPGAVYWSKVTEVPEETSDAMSVGNRLENAIIEEVSTRQNLIVRRNQFRVASPIFSDSRALPMSATHDALVEGRSEGIEVKYVGPSHADEWGPDGSDVVPPYVVLQVQHQMAVSDLHAVWVGAAIARWQLEFRVYRVARDNAIIEAIRETCYKFWTEHVVPRVPPDDATLPPLEVLRAIKREERAVEVAPNIVQSAIFWDRVAKRCDGFADRAKRALEAAMETGNVALLDGQPVYKLIGVSSKRFDAAAFKAAHPEMVAEYTKESGYQRGSWTKQGKALEVQNDGYDIAGLLAGNGDAGADDGDGDHAGGD